MSVRTSLILDRGEVTPSWRNWLEVKICTSSRAAGRDPWRWHEDISLAFAVELTVQELHLGGSLNGREELPGFTFLTKQRLKWKTR